MNSLTDYKTKETESTVAIKPYTMEEINEMLDEAERDFEAGLGIPSEEVFREIEAAFWDTRKEPKAQARKVK